MSKRLTTLALASAAVLGMATMANAQMQNNNTGNRSNDPELHNNTSSPSGSGAAMPQRQNGNMGTTGQGAAPPAAKAGNDSPPAGGDGRVNKKDQE